MKQLFTLITCIILFATCKPKDPMPSVITGLDPNFEKYLVDKKIDKDAIINGQMNSADAIGVDSLEVDGLQIKSLVGIENFVALKYLDCHHNQLSNLDVSKNLNLQVLYCYATQLSNLDVSENLELQYLFCTNNQLSNLDVSKNLNLQHLGCSENLLNNLDVSRNLKLKDLFCSENQLNILDVSENLKLEYLRCQNNFIKTICVNDLNKANTSATTINVYYNSYYWVKDPTANFAICK